MPSEILLLSGELESIHMAAVLDRHSPGLPVVGCPDLAALREATAEAKSGRRLIAFCTDVIVPADVLEGLGGPAYNFHPGPPEYPGSQVACFAVYEGVREFGVTVHEMSPAVDSGRIVAVRRFPVPQDAKFMDVEILAYKTMLALFEELAPHFATDDRPLPPSGDAWSGPVRTKAMAEKFREVEADMDEAEIVRRYRAFG